MHLLYQQFRDAVKTKLTGSLDEDNLIAQVLEHIAADKLTDGGEERLVGHADLLLLRRDDRTDADKLLNAALAGQVAHLAVELTGGHAALHDVAQDERADAAIVVGTAVHKVERNVERVEV